MIDSFGRRSLLLATFPFMAAFQLMIGLAYTAKNATTRKALVTTGMCKSPSPKFLSRMWAEVVMLSSRKETEIKAINCHA